MVIIKWKENKDNNFLNSKVKENHVFDMKKELLEYCRSDVDILRRGCLKLREEFLEIVGLGLHCLICFGGQISNNSNYQKKFEYFVKFILMKIRINLSSMEVYAQPIQNLWLRPLKSGYLSVALTLRRIFSATK
jgi:hypothetical protein